MRESVIQSIVTTWEDDQGRNQRPPESFSILQSVIHEAFRCGDWRDLWWGEKKLLGRRCNFVLPQPHSLFLLLLTSLRLAEREDEEREIQMDDGKGRKEGMEEDDGRCTKDMTSPCICPELGVLSSIKEALKQKFLFLTSSRATNYFFSLSTSVLIFHFLCSSFPSSSSSTSSKIFLFHSQTLTGWLTISYFSFSLSYQNQLKERRRKKEENFSTDFIIYFPFLLNLVHRPRTHHHHFKSLHNLYYLLNSPPTLIRFHLDPFRGCWMLYFLFNDKLNCLGM